jgi:predicted CXXCH cytochrome family protein
VKARKAVVVSAAVALLTLAMSWQAWGEIANTMHGFAILYGGWNTSGEICIVCHTPHHSKPIAGAPLWNRPDTTAVFTLYSSPSLLSTPGQPTGATRLCLGCHDGTVALESYGGTTTGTHYVTGWGLIGTNLSNDHPVSIVYDSALATASGGRLRNPSVTPSGLGSTIQNDMLRSGKLECVSCHNPHGGVNNNGYMLLKWPADPPLCLTCHDK